MIRKSKAEYYNDYFLQHQNNIKRTYDGIKSIINANKKSKFFPSTLLDRQNCAVDGPSNLANTFNDYFASVGASLNAKIPDSPINFMTYVPQP